MSFNKNKKRNSLKNALSEQHQVSRFHYLPVRIRNTLYLMIWVHLSGSTEKMLSMVSS